MKKRLLSALLAAVLTVGLLPMAAEAKELKELERFEPGKTAESSVSRDVGDHNYTESDDRDFPNDTPEGANLIGNDFTVEGDLSGTEQDLVDCYGFEITEKSEVLFIAGADLESLRLELRDENDEIIAVGDNLGVEDGVFLDAIVKDYEEGIGLILEPGIYYLYITDTEQSDVAYLFYSQIITHVHDWNINMDFSGKSVTYSCPVCEEVRKETMTNKVLRVYGQTRYDTATAVASVLKAKLEVEKFDSVVIASGKDFPDALSGSYLASVKNAPILMASESSLETLKSYLSENLKKGGTIYILGGTLAVSEKIENAVASYGVVKRLGGTDRYATNLLILEEAGVEKEDIIVCTGTGFADSLSASALGKPILLVNKTLTTKQKAFLGGLSAGNKFYIIGGTIAVNTAVEKQIKGYGDSKRVGGADRYETSVKIAEEFFANPEYAVVAYSQTFPDGLSAGPLAQAMNCPLILTVPGHEKVAVNYGKTNGIKEGAVLGGPKLVTDEVVKNMFGLSSVNDILEIK